MGIIVNKLRVYMVYVFCFVGGCMDYMSYIYLFKTLLGFMTFNTMIGIITLSDNGNGIFHLLIVFFFILMAFIMRLVTLYHPSSKNNRRYLDVEIFLIILYALLAWYALHHKMLQETNLIALALAVIGSFAMYLQNFVITHGHQLKTGTTLLTGNYVNFIYALADKITNKRGREQTNSELVHYAKTWLSFCCGILLMNIVATWLDFLGLLIPCAALFVASRMSQKK
ncbi:YoaK family protein [Yokenella regensburgei]|uniref:YoaK family protein n=2 Tax=Yokenella regensburgei TaxID=158877 RepID=UPI003EDACF06